MELYPKLVTLGHYIFIYIYMQISDLLYVYLDIELDKINKQVNLQLFSSGKSVFQLNGIRSLHSFLLRASV